jgi:plasmanylethanolamine desaturase
MTLPRDTDVAVPYSGLPRHDDFRLLRRFISAGCITTAVVLLIVQWQRFFDPATVSWMSLPFVVAGIAAADFLSGLIHWAADTWGSETMPLVGRRILHPFRVHHVNPGDFLRRRFVDTNGDVALVVIPFLVGMFYVPAAGAFGPSANAALLGFCTVGMFTNQCHQWAHMPSPPGAIRLLQKCGAILSGPRHECHHSPPHVTDYCIATGWCNGVLNRLDFFRRLEQAVTWTTGILPREDEHKFFEANSSTLGSHPHAEISGD